MDSNKAWFEGAKEKLEADIQKFGSIDGARFLSEYLNVNWPKELDESVDEEQFEAYVNENIDLFEAWLQEVSSDIEINDDYIWGSVGTISRAEGAADLPALSAEQVLLLQAEFDVLDKADFSEMCNVRNALITQNKLKDALKAALMAAKIGDKFTEIDIWKRAQAWEKVASLSVGLNELNNASGYYEKAGDIVFSAGYFLEAAEYYEKAANSDPGNDWREIHKLLRKARVLYANAGVNDNASTLYIQESNLKVKNASGLSKFSGFIYRKLSNYGESPWRVLGWIVLLIVFCAFLYWYVDINTPGSSIYTCKVSEETTSYFCNEIDSDKAGLFAHLYFSVVTFTTLGYGDFSPAEGWARFIASVQAFLGLMLSSLFIATFLRKFSR